MQTDESFVLAERASRPQQRFELRYAEALGAWSRNGFRWEIGPVEPVPPDKHFFSRLAQHVEQSGGPWRWLRVSHEQGGPVGYLALFLAGNVRDEAGRGLSEPALLAWGTRELDRAGRRILHQNRINTAINAENRRKYQRELLWVRGGCLVGLLVALVAIGVGRALDEGLLRADNEYVPSLILGLGLIASCAGMGLGAGWLWLHTWLARSKADEAAAR